MMLFGGIIFILFWAGVAALVYWVANGARPESAKGRDAIDVARERYARGEISREQFHQIRDDIGKAA